MREVKVYRVYRMTTGAWVNGGECWLSEAGALRHCATAADWIVPSIEPVDAVLGRVQPQPRAVAPAIVRRGASATARIVNGLRAILSR